MPRPTLVDPVNEIISTFSCPVNASPTSLPDPGTILNTPFGRLVLSITSASKNAETGVFVLGFSTTVAPASKRHVSFL